MKVSLEWLSNYVDLPDEPEELADILSMSGTSVERIQRAGEGARGVVVGRVVEVREHPAADNLRIAMVEDGSVVREVVCGAPNLRRGMKTALALPGAHLPEVSDKELKSASIRGVLSEGMLCSGAELGVSEDTSGIIELAEETTVGLELNKVLPLEDVVLDLEITPNRPDCMSMVGVAREVAALTDTDLRMPPAEIFYPGGPVSDEATVKVYDAELCPRYTAAVVNGVRVAPSAHWMQRRLLAGGMRPINNIVDVTNYVLLELGQPLHAFDLDLLRGRSIVVRLAHQGEQLATLDGVDRQLDGNSLVIADGERSVALAGIMGGRDSEVTEGTVNVLIESAYFEPTSILRTSRRLGLRSEASNRFEKGTDPLGTAYAARRAASLMAEVSGGRPAMGEIDVYPAPPVPAGLTLRAPRVNKLLGTDISKVDMVEILEKLEMRVSGAGEAMSVTVPTFRRDIEREIDLVEEIARVYGYDRVPESLPRGGGIDAGLSERQRVECSMRDLLISQGLLEAVTYSFMRVSDLDMMKIPSGDRMRDTVRLMNPLAETGEVMRTTILPGMLRIAAANSNRGNRDIALFEMGRVFFALRPEELPLEVENLCLLLSGSRNQPHWGRGEDIVDFYDVKGLLENLAARIGVEDLGFESLDYEYLAPGCSAAIMIGGFNAGRIGMLHPDVARSFGLENEVYVAELEADLLLESSGEKKGYVPVGRFPNVKLDIALIVDEGVEGIRVEGEIRRSGGSLLKSVRLFDVYRGHQIEEGKKSLAYALEFGSADRTLTDEETHRELARIVEALEQSLGAIIRRRELESGESY